MYQMFLYNFYVRTSPAELDVIQGVFYAPEVCFNFYVVRAINQTQLKTHITVRPWPNWVVL